VDELAIESSLANLWNSRVEGYVLDRQLQIQILLDHYEKPRHKGALDDADVTMPGGNPGCGDVVTVYLKAADDQEHIQEASYEGEGCTISMAASSMLLEDVHRGNLTMDQVLDLDYHEMIEQLGRQVVASRPRCATLGLGTLKAAIRKYQKDRRLETAGVARPDEGGFVFGEHAAEAAREQ
jgi:nitrogen fixation NifU-like protein